MDQWVNSINQVAEAGASGSGSGNFSKVSGYFWKTNSGNTFSLGRAQTLPAGQGPRGDEPKKRSFFTLKKK